jgi:hypothetical protein
VVAPANTPVPVCVHSRDEKFVADAGMLCPLKLNTTPWQVSESLPAFTVGDGVMVNTIWSFTATQLPLPLAVSVKVTVPVSPTPGW